MNLADDSNFEQVAKANRMQEPVVPIAFLAEYLVPQSAEALLHWLETNAPKEVLSLFWCMDWGRAYQDEFGRHGAVSQKSNEEAIKLLVEGLQALAVVSTVRGNKKQ